MSRRLQRTASVLSAALACVAAEACAKPHGPLPTDTGGSSSGSGDTSSSGTASSSSGVGSNSGSTFGSGLGAWTPDSGAHPASSSSGGAPSSGSGSGSPGGGAVSCMSPLIDNMNYMTNAIIQDCGRWGYWYAFNPGPPTATQFPTMGSTFAQSTPGYGSDPGVNGYNGAARTYGTGFNGSNYGTAGMGFDLYDLGSGTKGPYDATRFHYAGVTFYAVLGATPGAATTMIFKVTDKYSDPSGGSCDKAATSGPTQCYDDPSFSVPLTTSWTAVTVPFTSLKTVGYGYRQAQMHPTLDTSSIYQMQFVFEPMTNPFAIDVWIDQVSFM